MPPSSGDGTIPDRAELPSQEKAWLFPFIQVFKNVLPLNNVFNARVAFWYGLQPSWLNIKILH